MMQKELLNESKKAFHQIFLHECAYRELNWFSYLRLNPIRFSIFMIITKIIVFFQRYIVKKKNDDYVVIVKRVLLKNIEYIEVTNLILKRMYSLKLYFYELCLWAKVFVKLYRNK